ncbi:hypothetical protein, variant 2 [Exophiala mesophila]|uniref:Plastocyanin-like domain-containing protein n=1 Tax=Exophiala mesophila TaxID=212818 RepID=A0A0D2A556_EXOME|nr:hypothetical protein, variant 2 [Exophiala mesophila]KIV94133.1 hypothetical protein, variant 2 [Exophiala mesophila]
MILKYLSRTICQSRQQFIGMVGRSSRKGWRAVYAIQQNIDMIALGLLQRGTPDMDGVPGVTQFPIPPGGNFTYRFSTADEYGFYWYHSHFRAYYNDALRGPLLIHPSPSRPRPFKTLAQSSSEFDMMLQVERSGTILLLSDWYHRLSDRIYDEYFTTGAFPQCVDSLLANGRGRVQCLPQNILEAGPGLGLESNIANDPHDPDAMSMAMESSTTSGMGMASMSMDTASMPALTTDAMSMSMRKRSDHTASPSTGTAMSDMSAMSSTLTSMATMGSSTASVGTEDQTMSTTVDMPQMTLGPRGCSPPMMFRPGFNASSLPLETCTNTTSELFTFTADASRGWTALHLVNAGAVSRLSVSLDGHSMFVYEADGLYVTLQEVQVLHISIGQRYSVMIRLDQNPGDYSFRFAAYPYGDMQQVIEGQAILSYQNMTNNTNMTMMSRMVSPWMLVNGSATSGTVELDDQTLAPFMGNTAPSGAANVTRHFAINQTDIVTWVANREPFVEPARPIIYGSVSDGWNATTTLLTPANATVDIIMKVANDSMDTMGHPMHLHGHKFWFLGSGEGDFPFESVTDAPSSMINLQNPPYRDTIDLPPSGWAVIRYITDNPGAWLFHCHVQWHLVSGMAVVLVENEERMMDMVGSIQNAFNNPATNNSQAEGTSAASTLSGNCPRQYLSFLFSLLLLFVLL